MQLDNNTTIVRQCLDYIQNNSSIVAIPENFIRALDGRKAHLLVTIMQNMHKEKVEHFKKIIELFLVINGSQYILRALQLNLGLFVFCRYSDPCISTAILKKIASMEIKDKKRLKDTCIDLYYGRQSPWVPIFLLEYKIEKILITLAATHAFCAETNESFTRYLTTRNPENLKQAYTHVVDIKRAVVDFPKKELGWSHPFLCKNKALQSMLIQLDMVLFQLLSAHQISYEYQQHKEMMV